MASARENDLNPDTKIGLELPFARSRTGLFGLTETTLEQVGHNIKNLLLTAKGERLMQPNIGLNLRSYLFEQFTDDLLLQIQNEISDTMAFWLPFVQVKDLKVGMSPSPNDATMNRLDITVVFNITKNPDSLESVQVIIGE